MNEPLIFATAFEGVQRAFGPRITPDLAAKVKALGIDFDHLQVAYPFRTWLAMNQVLVGGLSDPKLSPSEQYRQWGVQFMDGFVQTTVGFATLTMARLLGPKRTMHRMGRNFRTSGNYTETVVTDLAANELTLRNAVLPEFISFFTREAEPLVFDYRRGVLEASLKFLKTEGATVEIVERDVDVYAATYLIRWA